jgi:hypothetical protein
MEIHLDWTFDWALRRSDAGTLVEFRSKMDKLRKMGCEIMNGFQRCTGKVNDMTHGLLPWLADAFAGTSH